jgi:hypothetical protein
VRTREKLRTLADVIAITIFWAAILFIVLVSGIGDCFEPGCGEAKDDYLRIAPVIVAIGFVGHVVGQFWLKARRTRRD